MDANQTTVSVAVSGKVANVTKAARKAGEAHPTQSQMVAYCVAAFADYLTADATLQNAKALWDAARMGLRTELGRAHRVIGKGKPWDAFKAQVRAALVKAKVCGTPKDAGRLVDNQLIALNLTGNGTRKGGKRKGAGRPESDGKPVQEKLSEKDVGSRIVKALAFIARVQQDYSDTVLLELMGDVAAILGGRDIGE